MYVWVGLSHVRQDVLGVGRWVLVYLSLPACLHCAPQFESQHLVGSLVLLLSQCALVLLYSYYIILNIGIYTFHLVGLI